MAGLSLRNMVEIQDRTRGVAGEFAVMSLSIGAAAVARILLEQVSGGVVPFLLTFPAVIAATLLVGTSAGIGVALGCQALTFWLVLPHWLDNRGGLGTDLLNLLVSCVSLAAAIWTAAAYRRLSGQLRGQCRREVQTLSLLIHEMDHRTKNNFQIAAQLLGMQARDADDSRVAQELESASTRLAAISSVYSNLLPASDRAERLDLETYLQDIIRQLRYSWLEDGLSITLRCDPVVLPSASAMMVGLVVNEWITNAVKHAFPDRRGAVSIDGRVEGAMLVVTVGDDGRTFAPPSQPGRGSRLIHGLAEAIGATIEVRWDAGMLCTMRLPITPRE